ncbi:MAG: HlyD family efflux transporter periplasmic adaptor subunit [Bacteroidales bacterium]|nr:HlyD family efflux transporter periplasmic adaptor subunit [Bacteroidales bacterium]
MKALISTAPFISLIILLTACSSGSDFDAQGTFEATTVTISAEATGKILALNVEEGDSIVAHQQVGYIDTLQLFLQKLELDKQHAATLNNIPDIPAQLASLRQQIAGAQTEYDRVKRLYDAGAATQRQLDDAHTYLTSLQGQQRGQLSLLSKNTSSLSDQAAAVDVQRAILDDRIAKSYISSPIDGVVLTKYAEAGEVAAFATPLFKVGDIHHMYLQAYFTSDQLANLRLGQKVKVFADYGDNNTREYPGVVSFIASESQFTPKTIQTKSSRANLVYEVKINVVNDGLLKIGLSGYVILDNDE